MTTVEFMSQTTNTSSPSKVVLANSRSSTPSTGSLNSQNQDRHSAKKQPALSSRSASLWAISNLFVLAGTGVDFGYCVYHSLAVEMHDCLVVSGLDSTQRSGIQISVKAERCFSISALVMLCSKVRTSALTVHCWWEDQAMRERNSSHVPGSVHYYFSAQPTKTGFVFVWEPS